MILPHCKYQIACHCIDYQATSGSAHTTNFSAKQSDVELKGASVKIYDGKVASRATL
ncbi:BZ3500_MvSof-1268-A1-R1_Chr3-1g05840 [Microbotryum saponariae]|uniref:BZ3500_MvSof-1268-A1-R1_Chr3-1g05840 protein n=1 Tax=Microbotryum saponariae TaxID=289078 RepID=A0A2X0LIN6_9BASI|nr:BZ3500_MvSof-1268-A1-R1_Chr3-1g05840 [Microbotryum saponariae]SDA05030.1 BZ3501_MvSof-1269-A2-R1_Chr3-1g05510 [Microbotryum saponariae]